MPSSRRKVVAVRVSIIIEFYFLSVLGSGQLIQVRYAPCDYNINFGNIIGIRATAGIELGLLAGTSRTRVTAILNRHTKDVSTDLMLRILARLGYRAKISFSKAA